MDFGFEVLKKDKSGARAGIIKTPHGEIKTPAFSPVATRATVKALSPEDLKATGTQVVLANTYHLYLRPGIEVIEKFGGFAPFMGWDGPTITDSGGYQVSFLRTKLKGKLWVVGSEKKEELAAEVVRITDTGAVFRSYVDGSKQLITPEISLEIQSVLNADIIMAFDQPIGSDFTQEKKNEAFERTLKWEERSFKKWQEVQKERRVRQLADQALYGIVQGGTDRKLRRQSLKFVLDTGFPGIAMGGESIGADPRVTAKTLDLVSDLLPDDKPLHALGLGGGPEGIFEAVERGVDTFDNSSITRIARSGLLFIYPEDGGRKENKFRIDLSRSKFKSKMEPVSKVCKCYSCQNFSAAYLHHLLVSGELLGLRLATIHNVHFINNLMKLIRNAISEGDFESLKKDWLE